MAELDQPKATALVLNGALHQAARRLAGLFRDVELTTVGGAFLRLQASLCEALLPDAGAPFGPELIQRGMTMSLRLNQALFWMLEGMHRYRIRDLEQRALRDGLTGLASRDYFEQRLRDELKRARRYDTGLALLLIDMDYLKPMNDNHGHLAGDAALRHLADVLKQCVRGVDVVARFGGDEFAVVMPDTGLEGGGMLAERLLGMLRSRPLLLPSGENVPLSVSVGVAAHPEHGDSPESLIGHADRALYEAKSLGGDMSCEALVPAADDLAGPAPAGGAAARRPDHLV